MSDEPDDAVKEFYPVWISSVEHVTTYVNGIKSSSSFEKFMGHFDLPDEFPYMKTNKYYGGCWIIIICFFIYQAFFLYSNITSIIFFTLLGGLMIILLLSGKHKGSISQQITFFSSGELQVDRSRIFFEAKPFSIFMWGYHNLDLDLSFELNKTDITEIGRFDFHEAFPQTIGKRRRRNPVRIRCSSEILDGDFLLLIGGRGPRIGKLRNKTDLLYEALVEFKNSGGIEF